MWEIWKTDKSRWIDVQEIEYKRIEKSVVWINSLVTRKKLLTEMLEICEKIESLINKD